MLENTLVLHQVPQEDLAQQVSNLTIMVKELKEQNMALGLQVTELKVLTTNLKTEVEILKQGGNI